MALNDNGDFGIRPRGLDAKQFIILRRIAYGPFNEAKEALAWADRHWPGEEHDLIGLHDPAKL